jgi:hypothetical protein
MSGREALLETMRLRWPDAPIRPHHLPRTLTQAQMRKQLTDMRYSPGKRSGRQTWLEPDAMKED